MVKYNRKIWLYRTKAIKNELYKEPQCVVKIIIVLYSQVLNNLDGVYTYTYEAEKKENCLACSQVPITIEIRDSKYKLQDLIELLCKRPDLQMKSPGLTTSVNGKNKTLYMQTVSSIEERTRENLSKSLIDLGLRDGSEINVADITTPSTIVLKLKFLQRN